MTKISKKQSLDQFLFSLFGCCGCTLLLLRQSSWGLIQSLFPFHYEERQLKNIWITVRVVSSACERFDII